jgi:hypothetical protein
MIEVFDSLDIFDFLYESAEQRNCAYVYFTNKALDNCLDQATIDAVYAYYEEFLPDDMLLIIKTKRDNIIRFISDDAAMLNAKSWFPNKEQLGELPDEYYFKCYTIDSQGIIYQN